MLIPLSTILTSYRPTDMLIAGGSASKDPAALWREVFASIERNHVACDPDYWARFIASLARGQREPIRLLNRFVVNGHHRVWGAWLLGESHIRATALTCPTP